MAATMPARHRAQTSVDHFFTTVQDLDEHQVTELLHEFNNTVESNVEVKRGIDFFQTPTRPATLLPAGPPPQRQMSFQKRLCRNDAAVPRSMGALRFAKQQAQAARRIVSAPVTSADVREARPKTSTTATRPDARSPSQPPQAQQPRSYKRISRPMLPTANEIAELNALVAAFLQSEDAKSILPSRTLEVPRMAEPLPSPALMVDDVSVSSLLEPESLHEPVVLGLRQKKSMGNIGCIF